MTLASSYIWDSALCIRIEEQALARRESGSRRKRGKTSYTYEVSEQRSLYGS
jgi:hypothetical protein